MTVINLSEHRVGCGDLLDATFQDELWRGTPASSGLVMLDWAYGAAIDADAARRSKAAGMRNGVNTCVTESWDLYEGDWGRYSKDIDLWLDAALKRRARHSAVICWGWSLSLPYVIACGQRHGLQMVTIFTWAKPTASPRFAKNCLITKSCEFAVIFRGKEKLDVFPPLIRDHIVCNPQKNRTDSKHQTPKPLPVWQPLIERFAAPGSCVYDPMMGSGVTLIACRASGRIAVCADREKWCYDETLSRYGSPVDGLLAGRQAMLPMRLTP